MSAETTALIRALNDKLRQTLTGGRVVMTHGVMAREPTFVRAALTAISKFDAFDKSNDPWDEHDFGAMEVDNDQLFWKIDYYDLTLRAGAEDPSDEDQCIRVLTVMMAHEY